MSGDTELQIIRTSLENVEIDEVDRAKMRKLTVLLIKIAKRLRAEELAGKLE